MQLKVPRSLLNKITVDLRSARRREIGGLLFGEHLEGEKFRLLDISVQTSGGTNTHFVRDPEQHQKDSANFFAKTGHDYARFNYLGEWHSHPSFSPLPSGDDIATMKSIVADPSVGANFALLMIVRLARGRSMEMSVTGFVADGTIQQVDVDIESEDGAPRLLEPLFKPSPVNLPDAE